MYPHPTPELTHLPTFGTTNPPPPIPMPPSHPNNMQFGQSNPASYQQTLSFEQTSQQESIIPREKEEVHVGIFKVTFKSSLIFLYIV